jgi:hypothetical protein
MLLLLATPKTEELKNILRFKNFKSKENVSQMLYQNSLHNR